MVKSIKAVPTAREFPSSTILFYDQKIEQHAFIKKAVATFKYKIALNAGESLKTLDSYQNILKQVQKIVQTYNLAGAELTFVAMGGGSVGDFVGFLAATYQRGRRLVMIPTTWLAAIDSAHGGKNGLNLNGVKNQIGTFYLPEQIYICEKILKYLPEASLNDAFAEALKIGIINRPRVFSRLEKNAVSLYEYLPQLIQGKCDIVKKDPFEKKGDRKLLNLGHTMGHVFESYHSLPHGQAVFLGILFSLRWSLKRKYITWNQFTDLTEKLFTIESSMSYQQAIKIPKVQLLRMLSQDKKKISQGKVDFIFIHHLGHAVRKPVQQNEIIQELLRQQREL